MDKTVITYCGDARLFDSLRQGLENGLPGEAIEWKRSFGRTSKSVTLDPKFEPFDAESVSSSLSLKQLLGQPILHTYWTECADMDVYKSSTKDEVMNWLTTLKKCGIAQDWMVVIVEPPESRKGNKLLPRTSVLDRLKTDLAAKQPERCVALLDPTKSDSRAVESWQTLLHRLRLLLLQAYNRTLGRFEENMRNQRERRNDPKWNFCDYFLLQEELAFVYEMLSVYDESLVQYDELDALFTQFVLNSHVSESPQWLDTFSYQFSDWTGLTLNLQANQHLKEAIIHKRPSLLDVRNYLFARQSLLLLRMNKPWEVARRCLSFLHNGVQELSILDVTCPPGSVACWVLLSTLEVLNTCQKLTETSATNQVQQYCLYTAELWSYCREKLLELGSLCGLMPKSEPNSQQLHCVVELSSGIRDDPGQLRPPNNPVDRLKEALSSKNAFQKYYLELSESAISTYKHIGRIRSARMVGLDLAKFYLDLGQVQKAVTFLVDGLKTFEGEGWSLLCVQTLIDTAGCYEALGDNDKFLRTCAQIACAKELVTTDQKVEYFQKMLQTLGNIDNSVPVSCESMVSVKGSKVVGHFLGRSEEDDCAHDRVIPDAELYLELDLESAFPADLKCKSVEVSLSYSEPTVPISSEEASDTKRKSVKSVPRGVRKMASSASVQRTPSNRSTSSYVSTTSSSMLSLEPTSEDVEEGLENALEDQPEDGRLELVEQFEYKQDRSLSAVRLVCKNAARVLRRKDSSGSILKDGIIRRSDFRYAFRVEKPVTIVPGTNHLVLKTKAGPVGNYCLNQLSLEVVTNGQEAKGCLDLLLSDMWPCSKESSKFSVISVPPNLSITHVEPGQLWAGIPQKVKLTIFTGSNHIPKESKMKLRCSLGLSVAQDGCDLQMANATQLRLPVAKPFETVHVLLCVKANLLHAKDSATIEHRIIVEDCWHNEESTLLLHFLPPFQASTKLQTALTRKFVQVSFQATTTDGDFVLSKHNVQFADECHANEFEWKAINQPDEVMILKRHSVCNYLWEISPIDTTSVALGMLDSFKAKMTVHYYRKSDAVGDNDVQDAAYSSTFEFKDFKTLYMLQSRVEPAKGGELCRASTICSLSITVEQINDTTDTSLMYEVLADQAVWAVCGRAAGVIDMETARKQTLVVEVMPLVGGHLALPRVRLSKYIPAVSSASQTAAASSTSNTGPDSFSNREGGSGSSSMPRLEPFSPGQVYNISRTARIHVLPPSTVAVAAPTSSHHHFFHHARSASGDQQHVSLP